MIFQAVCAKICLEIYLSRFERSGRGSGEKVVTDLKSNSEYSSRRTGKAAFFLCFLIYAVSYFGRNTFAACITEMENDGLFGGGFDSYISTAFLVCYGTGQFINGRLAGRIPPLMYGSSSMLVNEDDSAY